MSGLEKAVYLLALLGLTGPVIRNEMKEALPEERESRLWAFTVGVDAYAALLLRV